MKYLFTLAIAVLFTLSSSAQLSQTDRKYAINYLEATHQQIVETVSTLDEAAFTTQPEDGGWSVSNTLEHILLTEAAFSGMAMQTMNNSVADSELDLSVNDLVYVGVLANRGNKVTTAPPFEPSGKWSGKQEMLDELEKSRNKLIDFLANTEENLRGYKVALPFGEVDLLQLHLIIAAHSQRHLFQIQEVLAELNSN